MNWKEYNGYMISDTGLVTHRFSTELQKTKLHKRGYVLAHIVENGEKKWVLVHRLVATLFIPNPDQKPQVNHKDGNKTNNNVDNLEWVTNAENRRHAVEHGLIAKGDALAKKLNSEDAERIRQEYIPYSKDNNQYSLAKKYGVTQSLIMRIVNGKCWKV